MTFSIRTTVSKEGRIQLPKKELDYEGIETDDWVKVSVQRIISPNSDSLTKRLRDDVVDSLAAMEEDPAKFLNDAFAMAIAYMEENNMLTTEKLNAVVEYLINYFGKMKSDNYKCTVYPIPDDDAKDLAH